LKLLITIQVNNSFISIKNDLFLGNISDVLHKKVAEEGWMNVHRQLNDWGSIQNIVRGIENIDIHIELAWQTKDKKTLEKFINSTETFNADSLMIQVNKSSFEL